MQRGSKKRLFVGACSALRLISMCGIAGIVDLAGRRSVADGVIQRMTQAIIHRGPRRGGLLSASWLGPRVAPAQHCLAWRTASSLSPTKTGAYQRCLMASSSTTSRNAQSWKRAAIAWSHTATRKSSHTFGKRVRKACLNACLASLPWRYGMMAGIVWCFGRDPFRHLSPLLDAAGGLAPFRVRNQGSSGFRLVPARPDLRGIDHIFTFAALPGPTNLFRRRSAPASRAIT